MDMTAVFVVSGILCVVLSVWSFVDSRRRARHYTVERRARLLKQRIEERDTWVKNGHAMWHAGMRTLDPSLVTSDWDYAQLVRLHMLGPQAIGAAWVDVEIDTEAFRMTVTRDGVVHFVALLKYDAYQQPVTLCSHDLVGGDRVKPWSHGSRVTCLRCLVADQDGFV